MFHIGQAPFKVQYMLSDTALNGDTLRTLEVRPAMKWTSAFGHVFDIPAYKIIVIHPDQEARLLAEIKAAGGVGDRIDVPRGTSESRPDLDCPAQVECPACGTIHSAAEVCPRCGHQEAQRA